MRTGLLLSLTAIVLAFAILITAGLIFHPVLFARLLARIYDWLPGYLDYFGKIGTIQHVPALLILVASWSVPIGAFICFLALRVLKGAPISGAVMTGISDLDDLKKALARHSLANYLVFVAVFAVTLQVSIFLFSFEEYMNPLLGALLLASAGQAVDQVRIKFDFPSTEGDVRRVIRLFLRGGDERKKTQA
jgi:hypothetical protein